MNKSYLASGIPALILSAGLVSCGPDKTKEADAYRALAPKIKKAGQSIDLKQFTISENRELDLRDVLELDASAAFIDVQSTCRKGERDVHFKYSQKGARPLSVQQILPLEILLADLKENAVTCGFEITLRNGIGSRHIFTITPAKIQESSAPAVALEFEQRASTGRPRFEPGQVPEVKIRHNNGHAAQAQVSCRDVQYAAMPFNKILELDNFDYTQPTLQPEKTAQNLEQEPVQACRVFIREGGFVVDSSEIFHLVLPTTDLAFASHEPRSGWPDFHRQNPYHNTFNFLQGRPADIATFTLSNPLSQSRRVKVSKPLLKTEFISLYAQQGKAPLSVSRTEAVRLKVQSSQKAQINEAAEHWIIDLEPGASVTWNVIHSYPRRNGYWFACGEKPNVLKLQVEPVIIEILSANGALAKTMQFRFKDLFLGIENGGGPTTIFPPSSQCPQSKR